MNLNKIFKGFSINSLIAGIFFFLVLCSWYTLRPVRNELAVQNESIIFYLLLVGALVMLLINPLYSWVASRGNLKTVLVSTYSVFIGIWLLLIVCLYPPFFNSIGINADLISSVWFSRFFYILANVFSFFIVSIFWVVIINLFRGPSLKLSYGVIAAGGSLGAYFGADIASGLASTFNDSGLLFYLLTSSLVLFISMIFGLLLIYRFKNNVDLKPTGGKSLDAIRNLITNKEIRSIGLYMYLWTALMTIHWVTSLGIISDGIVYESYRIIFFADLEKVVIVITVFTQFFLINNIIDFMGRRNILVAYGFIFSLVFLGYYLIPTVSLVLFVTVFLRWFEYGVNKPSRELIFSDLKKNDRYKSTVLVDTFNVSFGDATGAAFVTFSKTLGLLFTNIPIFAVPIAGLVSFYGHKFGGLKED